MNTKSSRWNISNLLSLSRIIFLFPTVVLLFLRIPETKIFVIILFLISVATDFFDGYFARKFNQVTEFGKILDPLSDKICITGIMSALVFLGNIPLWFFFVIIIRDALILLGGVYLQSKKSIVLQSNNLGKWAVTVVAFTIFLSFLENKFTNQIFEYFLVLSSIMLLLSLIVYWQRFSKIMKGNTN